MRETRVITLQDVADAIEEKKSFYKEWLDLGIITKKEFDESLTILESFESALYFKSRSQERGIA